MATVVVFDVNETLLDMAHLDPLFHQVYGEPGVRQEWFMTLEEIWLTALVIDQQASFGDLARAALEMVATRRGLSFGAGAATLILDGMKRLPPHPDVVPGLGLLRDAGVRLAALTNGTASAARSQMEHAGLEEFFEQVVSADEAGRLKPAREAYLNAAQRLAVPPSEILMVAAHAWDIAGAAHAGCATAFVARPGKALNPRGARPDLVGTDLLEVAREILRVHRGTG